MFRRSAIRLLLLLSTSFAAVGQASPAKSSASDDDHSSEAFVIEQFQRKEIFENDGTSSRQDFGRIKIQSEAGVQHYGVLTFSYASGTGSLEIVSVRVHKPDGSVVQTPPENVQDMAAEITREAPFYSDLHEKHIAVKGLSAGDTLEFQVQERTTKPLAPGQFWTSYRFTSDAIVLDEQWEVSVPRERLVKFKSSSIQPSVSESGAYRVYMWHGKNLHTPDESNKKRENIERTWQAARGRLPEADIRLSSFTSWDEVGRWYGGLQEERVKPTPEISAKASELTKNAPSDDAKLRALYNYVSTQFHYIGVALGIGRYQPHSASVVLENQYGDCKDKHTLLASLLAASGIPAYPALISSTHEIDPDVPSPGQFDHVITVIPRADGMVWLDTTPEVAPYRYLTAPLRDKQALAIWKDRPASLVSTPAEPPFENSETFDMDAKLGDDDILVGNVDLATRGDLELLLRMGFRAVPLPQWKDLVQRLAGSLGFAGEVSEVSASSPEVTDQPFRISYKYTRKEFGDWANRRILAPEPYMAMPAGGDDQILPLGPTWLGPSAEIRFHTRVQLPAGYVPTLPAAIHLKQDFAQFDSSSEFKDGKLITERYLKTLKPEIPASGRDQYKQFAKQVLDEYGTYIQLTSTSNASSPAVSTAASMSGLQNLPDSSNPEASRLAAEARNAFSSPNQQGVQGAISSLYRAVAADPNFTRAWVMLGSLLMMQKQADAGTEAFHKAMASDPKEPAIPKALGYSLMGTEKFDEAVPVWQEFIKAYPEDADGPSNLGSCYMSLKKYSEAATAYESAQKLRNAPGYLQVNLAQAYLRAGDRDHAEAAYEKIAAQADPGGDTFNNAAFEMANGDLKLSVALDLSNKAVRRVEEESQKITLSDLKKEDPGKMFTLAAYWDTLGWVHEHMNNTTLAEQYLLASWKLTQDGVVAGHLCQLYDHMKKTAAAIQMCRLGIYRMSMSHQLGFDQYKAEQDEVQHNLDRLTGKTEQKKDIQATDIVIRERTFKLPRFLPGTESGEFFVLLAPDAKTKTFKVTDAKFISGSDRMKNQGKQLNKVDFSIPAPGSSAAHILKRGILGCYQYTGCSFVLFDQATVVVSP